MNSLSLPRPKTKKTATTALRLKKLLLLRLLISPKLSLRNSSSALSRNSKTKPDSQTTSFLRLLSVNLLSLASPKRTKTRNRIQTPTQKVKNHSQRWLNPSRLVMIQTPMMMNHRNTDTTRSYGLSTSSNPTPLSKRK